MVVPGRSYRAGYCYHHFSLADPEDKWTRGSAPEARKHGILWFCKPVIQDKGIYTPFMHACGKVKRQRNLRFREFPRFGANSGSCPFLQREFSGNDPFSGRDHFTGRVCHAGMLFLFLRAGIPWGSEPDMTHGTGRRRFTADDPERGKWQDPEQILSVIGLSAGMVFADIGCGEGYFALPAARRLAGRKGACCRHQSRCRGCFAGAGCSRRAHQPVCRGKAAEDTVFCTGCADIVFFGIDLHDLRILPGYPEPKTMLKPSGRLVTLTGKTSRWRWDRPGKNGSRVKKAREK